MVGHKETLSFLVNIRELRGWNVNEELHISSTRQPPKCLILVQSTVQNLDKQILGYHCL